MAQRPLSHCPFHPVPPNSKKILEEPKESWRNNSGSYLPREQFPHLAFELLEGWVQLYCHFSPSVSSAFHGFKWILFVESSQSMGESSHHQFPITVFLSIWCSSIYGKGGGPKKPNQNKKKSQKQSWFTSSFFVTPTHQLYGLSLIEQSHVRTNLQGCIRHTMCHKRCMIRGWRQTRASLTPYWDCSQLHWLMCTVKTGQEHKGSSH